MKHTKFLAGAIIVGALSTAAPVLAATTPATPTGGPIRIFVTPLGANGLRSEILITGAIADWGVGTSVNANGSPNPNGNFERLVLHHGIFWANSTTLNAVANKAQPVGDQATCSAVVSVTAPVTLLKGSGSYKGISGTITLTETFAFIAPRFSSGAHKGQCNESANAQPLDVWGSFVGGGTVHLG